MCESFTIDRIDNYYNKAFEAYCDAYEVAPEDITEEQLQEINLHAGNHIGFFLTWVIKHDFIGEIHEDCEGVQKVKDETMTGTEFLIEYCDTKLWSEDVADSLIPFIKGYYLNQYFKDYVDWVMNDLGDLPMEFIGTWEDYHEFEPLLDAAYDTFCNEAGNIENDNFKVQGSEPNSCEGDSDLTEGECDDEYDDELETLGWDAITEAFEKIYPGQENPKHYGVILPWIFGGQDPLEGISIYDAGDYWHFVTYGLSELYEKESKNMEYSGYGMEFTLKLKKGCYEDEEAEIRGLCGILQSIARITFNSGEIFDVFEYLYTGQTEGMDVEQKSKITGFITIPDEKAGGEILTPNGKVTFIEFIGVTDAELTKIKNKEMTVRELYDKLGTDVTDYKRDSVVKNIERL